MARSLLFNVLFYVTTTLYVVLGSPLLLGPRRWAMAALANHARFELWLLKTIVGTKLEVRALASEFTAAISADHFGADGVRAAVRGTSAASLPAAAWCQ